MVLPEPSFVERDGAKILAECIAYFEEATQRPLAPSQAERLLINMIAYRELLIRVQVQEAAKQNLVRYARWPMIDELGQIGGVERIPAKKARTTIRFSLSEAAELDTTVPVGTRVRTKDGRVVFATLADATIASGDTHVDVLADAEVAGPAANGYSTAQVTEILNPPPSVTLAASNVTPSADGAPSEDTEQFRLRIPKAVRALSVAGPEDAYVFFALSAHPSIVDVAVLNSAPRTAEIVVLTDAGVPSSDILELVEAACSSKRVRPITDIVVATAAEAVEYALHANLTLRKGLSLAQQADAEERAAAAAAGYVAELAAGLGRRYVDSRATKAILVDGVYSVAIDAVDEDVYDLTSTQFASCSEVSVEVVGVEP